MDLNGVSYSGLVDWKVDSAVDNVNSELNMEVRSHIVKDFELERTHLEGPGRTDEN